MVYFAPGRTTALACALPAAPLGASYFAPAFATTQALATPRMRAMAWMANYVS